MRLCNPWLNYWPLLQQRLHWFLSPNTVRHKLKQIHIHFGCGQDIKLLCTSYYFVKYCFTQQYDNTLHKAHTLSNPHRQITWTCSEPVLDCAMAPYSSTSSTVVGVRLGKVALAAVRRRSAGVQPEAVGWWVLEQMWREKRLTVLQSRPELTPHCLDTWSLHAEKEMRHMKALC